MSNPLSRPFAITIPSPGTILTRTIPASELVKLAADEIMLVEVDTADKDGETYRRSGLVTKVTRSFERSREPQVLVTVSFVESDLPDKTYAEADHVTYHVPTYEYVEKSVG